MTGAAPAWHISYQRCAEYEIVTCADLLDPRNDALLSVGRRQHAHRFVVVDENVHRFHAVALKSYFDFHNVEARIVPVPGGEQNKSIERYIALLDQLDSFPIERRDEPVIAIGGGVLTDLVGFVAGTYRRGIPHVKVPTTLIGYVDASVGIKSGVNFNRHKNRLGSFEPPQKVLLDRAFLQTLSPRHLLNGVCEILKLAVIADLPLFELLEVYGKHSIDSAFQDEPGALVLDRSVQRMVEELRSNLFEEDLARSMDFGHTFSYGLEMAAGSRMLHGEAVLVDVVISALLAAGRGLLSAAEVDRLLDLVCQLGIVVDWSLVSPDLLWDSLQERIFHRNGSQRIPLPYGIGACMFANDVEFGEIQSACAQVLAIAGA